MIIISRILQELSLQIKTANYFKVQTRPSSHLATVMFRGTPCSLQLKVLLRRQQVQPFIVEL